jgi:hypothetical protein
MVDKVRPLKLESTATGGGMEDSFPTALNPAQDYIAPKGIAFESSDDQLIDIDGSGNIQFTDTNSGTIKLSELLNALRHRSQDQLVHNVAETGYIEPTYNGSGKVTNVTVWTDAGKTIKRYEEIVSYDATFTFPLTLPFTLESGNLVSQVIARRYDGTTNNVVVGETITLTPSYTGGIVDNITTSVT